ncbi:N-formylglutamate amidohydrolase [Planktotalea arctica]|uniref:N-formylglutamate amidohydrolase n=1 Tax=Planktotalea arctica TaxID=1481893 RepID=UPI000A170F5B|nr:N-formylglutamate amidohydrolase [Planktotalea arctica]
MPRSGFKLFRPEALGSSVVFASPHSGREYAWSFMRRSVLSDLLIRSSEDAFVDLLIDRAPEFGAPLLAATVPRAFVDLNRSVEELDPALIEGVRRNGHNPRIASGLGVIPRVVANGRAIYRGKMSRLEANKRLNDFWHPYHAQLSSILNEAHQVFGHAILVDVHSMPREALDGFNRGNQTRPDVVLGDRFGASASGIIVDQIEAAFTAAGFTVARNTPFAGAYITQTYGRPSRSQHAVQIEIDRSIYMNEASLTPNSAFETVKSSLNGVLKEIADIGRERIVPLAAE